MQWRGCALPRETSLGHGGPQAPTSSSCTSPACRQGTTHSQKPGCHPGPSYGSATALLVTRAVWPKGTTCGFAAGVQGTTLAPPRATQGGGGTKARGPHLREEAGVLQGLGTRQPLPQPQRLKDISVPVLDLILILEKKKKKDTCALKSAPWPRPQRLFPNKALCRPPGPCAHHTLQGGCLPPGHWPLPPSSCWLGGLVGPSSWAPRSQPCVLGTRTLGSTGWPQRGAARPGAPEGGLRAPQHLLQGLCQQRRTPCWWVGFWKTLELHTLERCRRWGGGWQWGAGVPPVCSRGATGAPLLAVSPCLSQLWVPRCRPLVGGWDARVRAPRPWALPGCGCGLYLGVRGLPHPYHASAVTC